MKTLFTFLLIAASLLSFSQNPYTFSSDKYRFADESEIIIPQTDYSSVLIVFNESITDEGIREFDMANSLLSHNKAQSFPWKNKRLYHLDASVSKSGVTAESFLGSIRAQATVLSAYPAFIRNGDVAYLDNIMLVNMNVDIASVEVISGLADAFDAQLVEELNMISSITYALRVPAHVNIFNVCMEIHKNDIVNFAQPNFYFSGKADIIPNDPLFDEQWFLNQASDADIDAPEAWDITTGSSSLAVAVIDGHGYDMNHAEMAGKFISPYNGVEDNNDPDATESLENHGTPCAGLIGALTNNAAGVAGVGFHTLVVPIKMGFNYGSGGTFSTSELIMIRSCEHVMTSPYDIVAVSNSYTMGSWANIAVIRDAFANMRTDSRDGLGCVVLASTGNENSFNSVGFPFQFPHVVGVGSTDRFDTRSSFSNYGDSTDLVAPGTDIWTLDRTGIDGYNFTDYYEFSGTSASCPIASAVVALIASINPSFTWEVLQDRLCSSCDKLSSYSFNNNNSYPYDTWNQQVGYGRVNAFSAVQAGAVLDPPTNFHANVTGNDVHLSWTAPGGGSIEEELIYDNNENSGSYCFPGVTMSTHMSPDGPCQIIKLKYYTISLGSNQFHAKVFNWASSQPGTNVLYNSTQSASDNTWLEVDVSESAINVTGDFVVGFGSVDTMAYIGYDANLNNGRSWDYYESSGIWESYFEAYLIRAVVLYPGGKMVELGGKIPAMAVTGDKRINKTGIELREHTIEPTPNQFQKLLGLQGYKVYRDGALLTPNPIGPTTYSDNSLPGGTYYYSVTALYDEGESDPAGPLEVVVSNIPFNPPTNLQTSVNGNKIILNWAYPEGDPEQWLYYHDGTFEDSFSSTEGGAGIGQLFTLSNTPATLNELRFFTDSFAQWQQPMSVYVLTGDGTTVLGGPYGTNGVQNGWVSITASVHISQSQFIIATYNDNADGPYVGVDDSFYNGSLYFGNHTSGFTELSEFGEYEFVGSHEAKILYTDKSGGGISEWIKPGGGNRAFTPAIHHKKKSMAAAYPAGNKALLGFNLYRDNIKMNSSRITLTNTEDFLPTNAWGTYVYNVTAIYSEGESAFSNDASVNYYFGIDEQTQVEALIYPNPSTKHVVIESSEHINVVKLFGIDGRNILTLEQPEKQISIDVSSLEAGLYLIELSTDNGRGVFKLLVK